MEAVLVAATPVTAALVRGEPAAQAATPALVREVPVAQVATPEVAASVRPEAGAPGVAARVRLQLELEPRKQQPGASYWRRRRRQRWLWRPRWAGHPALVAASEKRAAEAPATQPTLQLEATDPEEPAQRPAAPAEPVI